MRTGLVHVFIKHTDNNITAPNPAAGTYSTPHAS